MTMRYASQSLRDDLDQVLHGLELACEASRKDPAETLRVIESVKARLSYIRSTTKFI
jgi:hypothetical protein